MTCVHGWNTLLCDHLPKNSSASGNGNGKNKIKNKAKEVCWKFNKGRCTYGTACKFDHRCTLCNRYGHGLNNCQRMDNKDKESSKRD